MKILIYGINYWPEITGIGKYSGELGNWLSSKNHKVNVVTAHPYYPEWTVSEKYTSWSYCKEQRNGVYVYRAPIYVPKRPKLITRLLHLISFSISSLPLVMRQAFWKPDVIFFVQPTLFSAFWAILLAKVTGAKSVLHIQDFEIDAMFGLGMLKQGTLYNVAKKIEYFLMSRFDMVSTISYSMMENAKFKGVSSDKLVLFPNWADTEFVAPGKADSTLKAEWGFSDEDKIVLYAGNIGKKQGLEIVLDAAEKLKNMVALKFVIVGTGAHIEKLRRITVEKNLENVYFKSLQPWKRVPEMLAMADIHLVVQKRGAADAVLPSKLTNILSIGGHSLVTAEKNTELGMLEAKFPGIYKCIAPEDPVIFTDALQELLDGDLRITNQVARDYAVKYLSKENVLPKFERDLVVLTGSGET